MIINYANEDGSGQRQFDCCPFYSFQDYTNRHLLFANLTGKVIYASCFSQEIPNSNVFPDQEFTLVKCNLSNCAIPPNVIVGPGCIQERFQVQEDGKDWIVDEENNPIEVIG